MIRVQRLEEVRDSKDYLTKDEGQQLAEETLINRGILELRNIQLRASNAQRAVAVDIYTHTMNRARRKLQISQVLLTISIVIAVLAGASYVF